MIQLVEFTIHS